MASKQRFLFTNNSLSKSGFLKGFFQLMLFQSGKNYTSAHRLLANYFKVDKSRVYLFGAGRMSVYSLIKSLKLTAEDEVVVAGYTCVVLTNAVKFTGCQIQYVDITTATLNLDTKALIESVSSKTKVLIIPHNFGLPYEDIPTLKAQFPNLIIIEDVAHTFGSTFKDGSLCGTIGDASFFSLEYSKPLTSGLGGIMLINNTDLLPAFDTEFNGLKHMRGSMVFKIIVSLGTFNLWYFKRTTFFQSASLRMLKIFRWQYRTSTKEIEGDIPDSYPVKMNKKLTCFLVPQLKRIEKINKTKRDLVQRYDEAFDQFGDLEKVKTEKQILVRYPILFKNSVSLETITAIKTEGRALGLNFGEWFNDVVHPVGSYRYGYEEGKCPNGEFVAKRILNLPVNANYPDLMNEIDDIAALFKKHGIN